MIDNAAKDVCNFFKFPYDVFRTFLHNYFPNIDEYSIIFKQKTKGIYFKVISSIFYYYANIRKVCIRKTSVSGLVQRLGYYHGDFKKYLALSYVLMTQKYNKFKPKKITRRYKIEQSIKKILGRLKKPILFEHVSGFLDLIGYDNKELNIDTVAIMYVMFYYRYVRGWTVNDKRFSDASDVPIGTLSNIYYYKFKKIVEKRIDQDFAEMDFKTDFDQMI